MTNGEWDNVLREQDYQVSAMNDTFEEFAQTKSSSVAEKVYSSCFEAPVLSEINRDRQWSQTIHDARIHCTQSLNRVNFLRARKGKPPVMWQSDFVKLHRTRAQTEQVIQPIQLYDFVTQNPHIVQHDIPSSLPTCA